MIGTGMLLLRIIFTVTNIIYLICFIQFLLDKPLGALAQVLIGDMDRNSLLYKEHEQALEPKIRQVYEANVCFITLFTVFLWVDSKASQLIFGGFSLIAFGILIIIEIQYRRLLKRLGDMI